MISTKSARFLAVPLLGLALAALSGRASAQQLDVPFVPTPHDTVATMLKLVNPGPDDILYDLGSGDGRIVIAGVRDFNVKKGVGVDLNPVRVKEANENAASANVTDRVKFVEGNVFDFDFSEATIVTMYLLESVNQRLRPRILDELRPGTRVVSHQFTMGNWEPDVHVNMDYIDVYHWIVPAKAGGGWLGEPYRIDLEQSFQNVTGAVQRGNTRYRIERTSLRGDRLRFEARIDGKEIAFDGRIDGNTLTGTFGGEQVTFRRAP